jgi:hypothetical protein
MADVEVGTDMNPAGHVVDKAAEAGEGVMVEPISDSVSPRSHLAPTIASDHLGIAALLIFWMDAPEVKRSAAFAEEMVLMALRRILSALRCMYAGDVNALHQCASAALSASDSELCFIGKCLAAAADEPKLLSVAGSVCEAFYNSRLKTQAVEAAKDFGINGADAVGNALYAVAEAVENNKARR